MNNKSLKEQFQDNGYIIIRNVLSQNEIKSLRNDIQNLSNKKKYVGFYSWKGYQDFIFNLLSNDKLKTIREIYSNPIIYPDFQLQISNSPDTLMLPHWDLQSFLRYGQMEKIKDINYSKIGLYLQDSNENIS